MLWKLGHLHTPSPLSFQSIVKHLPALCWLRPTLRNALFKSTPLTCPLPPLCCMWRDSKTVVREPRTQLVSVQAGRGTLSFLTLVRCCHPHEVLPLDCHPTLEVRAVCTPRGWEALGLEAGSPHPHRVPRTDHVLQRQDIERWGADPYCRHIHSAPLCLRTCNQLGTSVLGQAAGA